MTTTKYEVVTGTRVAPGAVLRTFEGEYKCGGPATACLRYFDSLKRKMENGKIQTSPIFFRRAS